MSGTSKLDMVIDYLQEHYPGHEAKLAGNPLVATATLSPTYSNPQINDLIDKVALFNGIKKS